MRKVSFRLRNFDKEQFLTYNIDNEAELDEDVLNFLEDEEPEGIVPVIFDDSEEDYDTFSYDITDKIHLVELSNQEINAEMVLMVMRGLVISLTNMAEYRIPLSYLVLHRNYIYIDSDYKVEFICIPLEDMTEEVDITGFLRGFLSNIRFDTSENGDYVAKLLSYINNPTAFKLHNLLELIEELMDDYGIEIPDDNGTGIYVDYQEVTEPVEADEESVEADEEPVEDVEESVEDETEEVSGETSILSADEYEDALEKEADSDLDDTDLEKSLSEEDKLEEDALKDGVAQETIDEAKELIDKIKQQVLEEKKYEQTSETDEEAEGSEEAEETAEESVEEEDSVSQEEEKEVTGIVLPDELGEFLAEKELEDNVTKKTGKDEPGIKMKKNIKVNRASIVNTNKEEQAAAAAQEAATAEEEEEVSGSIFSQSIGSTGILRGAGAVPKANPYLVRVNTNERIMITKQSFKIGKASMGVDYTVKGNGAVSRVHAVITNKDDVYYIKDNKSTNHTYVNGKVVEEGEEALLTHDSKIMLGDEEFVFKLR
ncbi:MAG: FHA domain-containing protein [Lachnospiraceae bacterium]